MTLNINTFRAGFQGTRPNRFRIDGSFPASPVGGNRTIPGPAGEFQIYAKATQLPGSSIGIIPVAWQGRVVKFSGERTYQDWSIQVYDSSFVAPGGAAINMRDAFEDWINKMNHRRAHTINYNLTTNWKVYHVDNPSSSSSDGHADGKATGQQGHKRIISLVNCFPIDLSPIDLSYDLTDTFSEFTVTLAFDHWEYALS